MLTSCSENYDLVNPDSLCSSSVHDRSEWDYEPLRTALMNNINALQSTGMVTHMSVYFRDLRNGPRFGIQENESFFAASLMKMPLMIALLHAADRHTGLLDKQLASSGSFAVVSNTDQPEETIRQNTLYSIRELLRRMIVYSDNNSMALLFAEFNSNPLPAESNSFLDLGIVNMTTGTVGRLSMQSYANLFTVLYNTSYLSDALSQYALELLSQSTYTAGLRAGVPPDVRVAHKFGLRTVSSRDSQLHDCGIVYHPVTPYVLCMMTSGTNVAMEANAIAGISRIVYDAVDGKR